MSSQGYTVNPVYSDDATEQELVDLQVIRGHSALGHDGQVQGWENDYYEDSEGQMHHRFSDVEFDEEDLGNSFNEDEYIEALLESNPHYSDAQRWATENLSDDELEEYNRLIDSSDLDDLHEAMEWLLEQYEQYGDLSVDDLEDVDDEISGLTPEETQILSDAVDSLQEQEPDEYVVDSWKVAALEADASGDPTYAMVASATASFHAGELTADEAISYVMESCDLKDLSRVYKYLMHTE